jgi:hypothetical protein
MRFPPVVALVAAAGFLPEALAAQLFAIENRWFGVMSYVT